MICITRSHETRTIRVYPPHNSTHRILGIRSMLLKETQYRLNDQSACRELYTMNIHAYYTKEQEESAK